MNSADFDWGRFGLSNDPNVRHGQLAGCCTPAAMIWAVRGEGALMAYLTALRP